MTFVVVQLQVIIWSGFLWFPFSVDFQKAVVRSKFPPRVVFLQSAVGSPWSRASGLVGILIALLGCSDVLMLGVWESGNVREWALDVSH